jgi:LPXTG-site transpeptidase (sortase) family protein
LNHRVWTSHLGSALIALGICLVGGVAVALAWDWLEARLPAQPRVLVTERVIWPAAPPMTPLPMATLWPSPTPAPTPPPVPAPPVWIEIPSLGVERAIVPLKAATMGGRLEWDSESLFATASRRDLVGHLEGSANPGQRGNVVLAGHNYNRGAYRWSAVFVSLSRLKPGDTVRLVDERDQVFEYQVERVDEVPFQRRPSAHTLTHIQYLSPSPREILTLTTCGGGVLRAPFPNRVYVVAARKR